MAAKYGLGNLTAIVDRNGMQQYGWPLRPDERHRGDRRDPFGDAAVRGGVRGLRLAGARDRRPRLRRDPRRLRGRPRGRCRRRAHGDPRRDGQGPGLSFTAGAPSGTAASPRPTRSRPPAPSSGRDPTGGGRRHDEGRSATSGRTRSSSWRRENPDLLLLDARPRHVHPGRPVREGAPGPVRPDGHRGAGDGGHGRRAWPPWASCRGSSSFAVFFTHRAVDQVRMSVAQTHANVKIGAAYSGLQTGFTGKTHLDVQDLAIMRAMPGMTVLAPGDATECAAMVRWATATPGPGLPAPRPRGRARTCSTPRYAFEPGRVIRLREGSDVLLVSTGQQTARCLAAADAPGGGRDRRPASSTCRRSSPWTPPRSRPPRATCPLVVTVEEHTVLGGLGSLVAEIVTVTRAAPRRADRHRGHLGRVGPRTPGSWTATG